MMNCLAQYFPLCVCLLTDSVESKLDRQFYLFVFPFLAHDSRYEQLVASQSVISQSVIRLLFVPISPFLG